MKSRDIGFGARVQIPPSPFESYVYRFSNDVSVLREKMSKEEKHLHIYRRQKRCSRKIQRRLQMKRSQTNKNNRQ